MTVLYVFNILMFKIAFLKPAGIFAMISWRQRQTFLPVRYAEIFKMSSQGACKQKSMVVVRVEGEVTKWYAGSHTIQLITTLELELCYDLVIIL